MPEVVSQQGTRYILTRKMALVTVIDELSIVETYTHKKMHSNDASGSNSTNFTVCRLYVSTHTLSFMQTVRL